MKRAIVIPAELAVEALDELKSWLAISTPGDNGPLTALLRSSLEMFESFTGQIPLECTCKEVISASGAWQAISTQPVQAIIEMEGQYGNGQTFGIPTSDYDIELDAGGGAHVRIRNTGIAQRIAVFFVAGIAPDWASLPDAVRHGVIRLAAHNYRQRDEDADGPVPPASIAALWRPWRRMRLS